MKQNLVAVVLGAIMILTTAAAFAESARDRESPGQLIEQPATEALDVAVVSGAPAQYNGPFYELRLDNRDHI